MRTAASGEQHGKRAPVVYLETLSINRRVVEMTVDGPARCVNVGIGNPPAAQSETVVLDTLAAEIELVEIGPNQTLNMVTVRIVTPVLSESVERTGYIWRDLDGALRGADASRVN